MLHDLFSMDSVLSVLPLFRLQRSVAVLKNETEGFLFVTMNSC